MKAIRCVALDLDGTSLNDEHHFSDHTKFVLNNLSSLGITIAFATGRTTAAVIDYIKTLELSQEFVPISSFNGGHGSKVHLVTGQVSTLASFPIPADSSRMVVKLANELGLCVQYYNGETGDVLAKPLNDEHWELLGRYAELTARKQVEIDDYEALIQQFDSPKLIVLTKDPEALIERAKQEFPAGMFHIIKGSPDPYFVEFLFPTTNKGACLKEVLSHFEIHLDEVVAFGDGDNDAEMLSMVGIGCAVKNAKPVAKSVANIVLEHTNVENAVAKQLELMLEQGQFHIQ